MKPVNILLVEDNEGDILLTQEALEDSKAPVNLMVVRDGHEAIHFIKKSNGYEAVPEPDFILLDINLPKRNGHEVLDFIKSQLVYKHIPVIMLTTSSSQSDIQKCYKNYANCYIIKPLEVSHFMEVVSLVENFWANMVKLPNR